MVKITLLALKMDKGFQPTKYRVFQKTVLGHPLPKEKERATSVRGGGGGEGQALEQNISI